MRNRLWQLGKVLWTWVWLSLPLGSGSGVAEGAEPPVPDQLQFNRDVRPILADQCLACHGPDATHRAADLRLDVREEAVRAGALVPGKPDASELVKRIESTADDERMPPPTSKKVLSGRQREILRRWVAQGGEYQRHWAFEPPQRAACPDVPGATHPIDRLLQHRLAAVGLSPAPRADAETLLRRVSLDLTGLPPTLAEIDDWLAAVQRDPEAAYRALVDRLLDSPHYGERWGRWWLDQARYADSHGYSIDAPRQIWKYRDWVINAFNTDLPFDEFTLWQLAGDLLPNASESQRVATGFHRNTQINQEGGIDREQFRVDSVFDRVATTGSVWLGLSVGCAQCHDHKFDPLTQREYYGLFAFLNNQDEPTIKVFGPGVDGEALVAESRTLDKELAARVAEQAAVVQSWEAGLTDEARQKLPAAVRMALGVAAEKRNAGQRRTIYAAGPGADDAEFQQRLRRATELEARLNNIPTTLVLQELPQPRRTTVFIKGDFTRPADEVTPGTPAALHPFDNTKGRANRIDLARWLTSPQNPLTARVIANRVWQQFFGRGIVETDNDFGAQGTPPTHPELLDYLALEFRERGWRFKELHRLIVTSHAYQQSSQARGDGLARDPANYLLWRQTRLRLEAEIVRDVALTASGLLSRQVGGPPVYPPIPEGVMGQGQVKHPWNVSTGADRYRRGCYTFIFRATPPPALNVFDAPDGYSTCTRRIRSNTPLQALTLLNDAACVEFAGALEQLVRTEGLETAFRRCTGRRPEAEELAVLQVLDPRSAARVLLNLDETITRE
ncbi:MAG: PSD1 and planctomycete cytochrome C domain-containing protein [Pirellulales bacterium]